MISAILFPVIGWTQEVVDTKFEVIQVTDSTSIIQITEVLQDSTIRVTTPPNSKAQLNGIVQSSFYNLVYNIYQKGGGLIDAGNKAVNAGNSARQDYDDSYGSGTYWGISQNNLGQNLVGSWRVRIVGDSTEVEDIDVAANLTFDINGDTGRFRMKAENIIQVNQLDPGNFNLTKDRGAPALKYYGVMPDGRKIFFRKRATP